MGASASAGAGLQRAPLARWCPPGEPRASPGSAGRRAAAASQERHEDCPRARSRPGAPHESQATSHQPRRACARECCGHSLAVPPRAHRHCPTPYRSCSPVTRTSAMRSSSLCCAPPLPLGLLSLPPLPALPPSMLRAVPLPLSLLAAAGLGVKSVCPHRRLSRHDC